MTNLPCMNCISPASLRIKLDKKGRPCTFCSVCGTRQFIHSVAGLRGMRLLAPELISRYAQKFMNAGGFASEDAGSQQLVADLRQMQESGALP